MSGGIHLSTDLVSDIKAVVSRHDPQAENDLFLMQYLVAVTGYVLADQNQPGLDKKALIADLSHFMGQVHDQVARDRKPPEDAFGIWKPGDN